MLVNVKVTGGLRIHPRLFNMIATKNANRAAHSC